MASDVEQLERIVEKLDSSIDKLTEVSANISKLLAVQEQRMNNIEKDTDQNQHDIRHIYMKMDQMSHDLVAKIDQSMESSKSGHAAIQDSIDRKLQSYDNRLRTLEIWRWLIIGGAIATGWIFNKFFK